MRRPSDERGDKAKGINRRTLLVGGGAAAGLLIAWGAWPREYRPQLAVAPGETVINAFLKIDTAGQVIVVVPQLEVGQGVTTILPQILADELGADWRTVAVQGAPVSPLYANHLLAREFLDGEWSRIAGGAGDWALRELATRNAMMLTGGSTSVRQFAQSYREAGAAARALLCKAAGARWDVPWESCEIQGGLVTDGRRTLRLGELAAEAATFALPDVLPGRQTAEDRLTGQDVPRLDLPSKVDGSHNYAGDIRLPGMVFASVRQGPVGAVRLKSLKEAEAGKVAGFIRLVRQDHWVAAVATNWWAANKALDALDPVFEVEGEPLDSASIGAALEGAFEGEGARRVYEQGDLAARFSGARLLRADYDVAPALHLAIEPPCATARVADGQVELWVASQAPAFCRSAVAHAMGLNEQDVLLYPVAAGGSFGRRFEHDPAVQAALIARETGRPVQLQWSRLEDIASDRPRAPAHARMTARLVAGGKVEALSAKVAAPSANHETWDRVYHGSRPLEAARSNGNRADARAVSGMPPLYASPHVAIDHYPADTGLPVGRWRGNADSYTCFFSESFMNELAHEAGVEPMSFRIQHLGGQPRLAHCLTPAAVTGGWQGGAAGSGQGIACHAMDGGFIALLIEAELNADGIRAKNIVAVADLGAQPHPDIARQQVEGGIIFGLAAATGAMAEYSGGMPVRAIMGRMGLPRLADVGSITVELVPSQAEPAGTGQIGVPAVAPALAGALFTLTGRRHRRLPFVTPAG